MAVAPGGKGVYTASNRFVVTDEEDGSGYYRSSAVGAYAASKLRQLPGKRGCVLFAAQRGPNPGCARAPASRGPGFLGATSIAVTPDGRHVLAGFSGSRAVALLKRDRSSQALSTVGGAGGCVAEPKARRGVKRCTEGRGIGDLVDIAISPDGRNAYVLNGEGFAVLRLQR